MSLNRYIVSKNNKCFSKEELHNLYIEFPYRKDYLGDSSVKYSLEHIFKIDPIIKVEKWYVPDGKVVNKLQNFSIKFPLSNTVITSVYNHWDFDQIIDYYSEHARIVTPGYGEKYSPYDYWTNEQLWNRWYRNTYNSLEDVREGIYNAIQEARPAYALISKSLYKALMNINPRDTYKILDIAAYGERAIAAASLPGIIRYDGIDPNYDLIEGHDKLVMDLETLNPDCNIRFIHVGLENFKSSVKYDIITYSPPPFNTEPYALVSDKNDTQSYIKYPTVQEYFCCFLVELIYKAMKFSHIDTIFSFTALDRNPSKFQVRLDKKYVSDNLELIYVEALLLVVSCFGFQYEKAIGLAAGGKNAKVPWWTFKYTENIDLENLQLLKDNYPEWFTYISARLVSYCHNINIDPKFEEYRNVWSTEGYKISQFMPKKSTIILELIRLQIQQYVIETISKLSGIKIEKMRVLLGRYLMMRSITATFEKPWESCLYVDPVFPTKSSSINEIKEQLLQYFIEQKVDKSYAQNLINEYKYWFGSYECVGIDDLYDTIANYISTIPMSNITIETSYSKNGTVTLFGNKDAVDILKSIPKGKNVCGIYHKLWSGIPDLHIKNKPDILAYLRYQTLGSHGHQFTRSSEKTKVLEQIFKMPLIDIYASRYNNQSEKYCSIYPDVEFNSIGSAFCLKMIEGAFLANPVDVPVFLEYALKNIINDLNEAKNKNKNLLISMGFNVWTDIEHYFISEFTTSKNSYRSLFKRSKNVGLNILSESEFIRATYILDKNKYPSILLNKSGSRELTISVGVILGSLPDTINKTHIIKLVENENYIQ